MSGHGISRRAVIAGSVAGLGLAGAGLIGFGRGEQELRTRPLDAPSALTFAPQAVTLYRSHTGGGGSRYEPLARVPVAS